jgi:hypothetical protein
MVTDDPWFWNVNDLVAEVCHSTSLFQKAGCKSTHFPDAAALEDQLREQDVTGKTFLTALDSRALQYKLQILHLGQTTALMSVIELLRRHSIAYQQYTATAGVQALNIINEQPSVPLNTETNDRKRRKIAPVTTTPLPTDQPRPNRDYAALAHQLESQPPVDGTGDWDFLARWQKDVVEEDDEQAFEQEDLDDEACYSPIDIAEEDPQDMLEDVEDIQEIQSKSKLRRDQVVDIINERILHYTNTWKPNKGALRGDEIDYDPILMWEEAEATRQRQQLVAKYTTDVAYYRQRLDILCDEIVKVPGNNADTIRRQCANLEVTIDSLELADWLLSIYSLEPVEESDEEEHLYDRSLDQEHVLANGHPQPKSGVHQSKLPVEIIDLGSPESSQGDNISLPIKNPIGQGTPIIENRSTSPKRYHTPPSGIASLIEPSMSTPTAPILVQVQLGDKPEESSIASVRRWKWTDLVATQDRKRIVTKALQEMKWDDRETIRKRLKTVGKADMVREVPACISMLARRETKMQGVLPRDMPKIITFTRLFLCWWLCDNYFSVEPSKWHLDELQWCLEQGSPDPSTFCDYLVKVMTTTFSPEALGYSGRPSQAEVIDISSDDEEASTQRKGATQRLHGARRSSIITLD